MMSHKKLGMWLFVASDAMTFSALLAAYLHLRAASTTWPVTLQSPPAVLVAAVMTGLLVSSSFTVFYAVKAANSGNTRRAVRYLVFTILGGLGFLILHLNEWRGLIQQGVRLAGNPWGTPLFGGTFFTLTGLHMAHVAIGVLYLGFIAHSLAAARCTAGDVEVSSVYWYFVDVVWIFLFATVYLLPA